MEMVEGGFTKSCAFAVVGGGVAVVAGLASCATGIGTVFGILGVSWAAASIADNCGLN